MSAALRRGAAPGASTSEQIDDEDASTGILLLFLRLAREGRALGDGELEARSIVDDLAPSAFAAKDGVEDVCGEHGENLFTIRAQRKAGGELTCAPVAPRSRCHADARETANDASRQRTRSIAAR